MNQQIHSNYFWTDERVTLRSVLEGDWEPFYNGLFDSQAQRYLNFGVDFPPTVIEAKEFEERFKDIKPGNDKIMLTIENKEGHNVGGINITSIDEKNGTFSIGLYIDQEHRGKGYGTAALRMMLKYAFFERRLNKFYGSILEGNAASAAMLLKVGCREEGRRSEMAYTNGKYFDEIYYGMTRKEFDLNNVFKI